MSIEEECMIGMGNLTSSLFSIRSVAIQGIISQMRSLFVFFLLSFLVTSVGCCTRKEQSGTIATQSTGSDSIVLSSTRFPLPEAPLYLHTAEERAEYLSEHYWERIDLKDSTLLTYSDKLREVYADYCGLLSSLPNDSLSQKLVITPLERSYDRMLSFALEMYNVYLFRSDSPIKNEELYRKVLEWTLSSPKVSLAYQDQARLLLELLDKNRVGSLATDITYYATDKKARSMYAISTPYTLLVLATPSCPACKYVVDQLSERKDVKELAQKRVLTPLVIYVRGGDEELSLSSQGRPDWLVMGHDQGEVLSRQLYDFQASPTVYLLDKSKSVILKDTSLQQALHYINQ